MLLLGGEDALSGLQNVTIVAALPFVVITVGLAAALVKDLSRDPQVVRRQYAVAAIDHAVVAGVSEHGDDFAISIQETPPGEGVGELEPARFRSATTQPGSSCCVVRAAGSLPNSAGAQLLRVRVVRTAIRSRGTRPRAGRCPCTASAGRPGVTRRGTPRSGGPSRG